MRVTMIGAGYVGLVSGACFADFGHQVTVIDRDAGRVAALNRGEIPIFKIGEAGLEDRYLTAVEGGDSAGVPVDHRHLMTEIGKAGSGDEPDIAGPDHGHAHEKDSVRVSGLVELRG